ncbi:MAG TPA: hypothetical protein VK399_19285 [Longimicrobiaceae bacterium]|jgi:type III restriction enzyme|nr:hypothetical protein [Longimicrobiaceae bacterium]
MVIYRVPGVSSLGTHGRWAFAELMEVYRIEDDFEAMVAAEFDRMVGVAIGGGVLQEARR